MRLFIGIVFRENIIVEISKISNRLQDHSLKGNFTHKENFHLTLVFLGDVDSSKVKDIEDVIKSIEMSPFMIELNHLGNFKRNRGDIYWIGIKENKELHKLNEELSKKLRNCGFVLEDRSYTPHFTLARNVKVQKDFNKNDFSSQIGNLAVKVDRISLMLSHRVNDKLTYTPLIDHLL